MVHMQGPMVSVGHGVRVAASGDELVVFSEGVDLGWRARTGRVAGTAVEWDGRLWEAVEVGGGERIRRWRLAPWNPSEVIRHSARLDDAAVAAAVAGAADERRGRRHGALLTVAAPVLGFAPGGWQQRWADEYGYPAMLGVVLSSLIEVVAGAAGIIQIFVLRFGEGMFLPWPLRWLVVAGPVLFAEGFIRLKQSNAHGEPIGSILSTPLLVPGALRRSGGSAPAGSAGRPGFLPFVARQALLTSAFCFAPGEHQARWAERLRIPGWFLTLLGGGLELIGGLVDVRLESGVAGIGSLLSLFFLAEGSTRLFLLILGRRPVGSLLGLPLTSLYERWLSQSQ